MSIVKSETARWCFERQHTNWPGSDRDRTIRPARPMSLGCMSDKLAPVAGKGGLWPSNSAAMQGFGGFASGGFGAAAQKPTATFGFTSGAQDGCVLLCAEWEDGVEQYSKSHYGVWCCDYSLCMTATGVCGDSIGPLRGFFLCGR